MREYRMEDLPHIRSWVNDEDIVGNLSEIFMFPQTYHNTESFLKSMVEGNTETQGFIIAEKDTLDYIGQIDLHRLNWRNRSATLGIVIGRKEMLGQGYGREAIGLLQRFVFETLNLNRLELEVYGFNERAHRCYLSCGFKEEGRARQKIFKHGKYHDVILMSILAEEYRETAK
ncbi:RimJ/RimL family protein N-acetyltransferase [Fontibacillus phaseoli]|uniref:RimJ/RimL family protein N-acetyltransferase n=1 Tax=Fontibacillus phaseoli TaxID=1416533 RepID=A0A369BLT2_9BACL|nr:RimJ/RimL family protein N-acetyltransferase [Fontibacillus phaseoli]